MVYRRYAPRKTWAVDLLHNISFLSNRYNSNRNDLPDLGGFTAPYLTGRPHMGPGNRIYPEKISDADEPYRQHDIGYGKQPWWKYIFFNSADAKLMSDLASSKNPIDMGVNSFFAAKAKYTGTIGAFLEMSGKIMKEMADAFGWNTVNNSVIKRVIDNGKLAAAAARSFQVPNMPSSNTNGISRTPRDFRPMNPTPRDFRPVDPIPAVEPQPFPRRGGLSKLKTNIYYTKN